MISARLTGTPWVRGPEGVWEEISIDLPSTHALTPLPGGGFAIFENDYDPEGVVDVDTWISADGAVWESAGTPAFAAADILRLDVFSGGSGPLAVIDHEDGPCELWSSSDGIDWVLESDYPTPDNPYPGDRRCGTPTDLGLVKGSEMSVDGGRTWFDIPPSPYHPSACQGGGYNSAFPSDAIVHFGGNGGCAEIWVGTFES